jgi:hypothetical protein
MSELSVSDLVFRDLDPDIPTGQPVNGRVEASLREELEKLRPDRPAPRVTPAADSSHRGPRRER